MQGTSFNSLNNEDEESNYVPGKNVDGFPFYVYYDALARNNHFVPSGLMGDWSDIIVNGIYQKNPKKGKYCIKLQYTVKEESQKGWVSISWQNPAFNWGGVKGGYNLFKAKKLYFYARGRFGGEKAEFLIGGIKGFFSDTVENKSTGLISLTTNWQLYELDLTDIDLTYISRGFCVMLSSSVNPEGCTIYLDEIFYTDTPLLHNEQHQTLSFTNSNRKIKKVAVMEFENTSRSKDLNYLSKVISEAVSTSLAKIKEITVMDIKSIDNNLKTLSLTIENFHSLNEDKVLGKIMGLDIIIRGSYVEVKNQILINIKLVDILTGSVIASDQKRGTTGKDLFLLLDKTSAYINEQIKELNESLKEK